MISTDRITVRPVHTANRRVLVGSVLALAIAVGIVAGLAGRLAAPSSATTAVRATVRDLAAFSPSIMGDASLLDSVTSAPLPSGYSDWLGGDQSRETRLTAPGTTAVSSTVSDLATFSPSILGDASLVDAAPSPRLPTGYSDWLGGDQSREAPVTQ